MGALRPTDLYQHPGEACKPVVLVHTDNTMAQGQRFKAVKPDLTAAPRAPKRPFVSHPNSLAALAKHRWSWSKNRKCRCGRIALRGSALCWWHGRAKRRPDAVVSPERAARRELTRRRMSGGTPAGLLELELWHRLAFGRLSLAPYALALLNAWDNREADPEGWARAVRDGRRAVEA